MQLGKKLNATSKEKSELLEVYKNVSMTVAMRGSGAVTVQRGTKFGSDSFGGEDAGARERAFSRRRIATTK